jgi:LacI family transcriptional regulator
MANARHNTIKSRRRAIQGPTISDVAARAGVSPMTVSRVINAGMNVRAETREAVNQAIRELDYRPSQAARNLAGSQSHRIGVFYAATSMSYMSEFLLGALDQSSRAGAQVLIEKTAEGQGAEEALAHLLAARVDGLLLPPPLCESADILARIRKAGVAAVGVATGHPSTRIATVRIDNEAAAREVTDHLIALGHRRFGFIGGHPNQTVSAQRQAGFLAALERAGLPRSAARIEPGLYSWRSGLAAAEKLLAGRPALTALFAANDDMAAAAAAVAHRMGLAVPEDVSIVGFDDSPMAVTVWPALTTVQQPVADMARSAVSLLISEIRRLQGGGGKPRDLLLPHTLVVRESSGPAPTARQRAG